MKKSQSSDHGSFVKRIAPILAVLVFAVFGLAIFVPGPIYQNSYMGAEYCGSCHKEEYRQWAASPHRAATDSLPVEHKENVACLSCHATGVIEAKQPYLKGVQCETCHGPGQYYAHAHIKKDPTLSKLVFMHRSENVDGKVDVKNCLHCHSQDEKIWSPHDAMKKIDHWSKPSSALDVKGG